MAAYDSVLFDLDGTLWDITPTVANARNNIIRKLSLKIPLFTPSDIALTIGMPQDEVYQRAFPSCSPGELKRVENELEAEIGVLLKAMGASVYPGVAAGLERLSKERKLFIVSNCGSEYLKNFIECSGFRHLFKDYECFGNTGLPKSENIKAVVQRNSLKTPVYVGDTQGDHEAAIAAGLPYIHMNYGFGRPLFSCPRVGSFSELVEMIIV